MLPDTEKQLRERGIIPPIKVVQFANSLKELKEIYGNPDANGDFILDPGWYMENIRVFNFVQPMRSPWGEHPIITRFTAHKKIGNVIIDAFDEVFRSVGVDEMRARTWDYFAGCWAFRRNVNAPEKLSVHSWGVAIDQNPHLAPNGKEENGQPDVIVKAFEERGFRWVPGDWMHAQACWNY